MNILLLGGTGFLGYYLKKALETNHLVDFSYGNNIVGNGFLYKAGVSILTQLVSKKFDLVINNINPLGFSETENIQSTYDVINYCKSSNVKLLHVSSVFALPQNKSLNNYNFLKAQSEELISKNLNPNSYVVLRFTQLFDSLGLARKSQSALYYLLDNIKYNQPISFFFNSKTCLRNYTPVEIAVKLIEITIEDNLDGIFNAHLDDFTHSIKTIAEYLISLNSNFDFEKNIGYSNKIGFEYQIDKQSDYLISRLRTNPNLYKAFEKAYEQIDEEVV